MLQNFRRHHGVERGFEERKRQAGRYYIRRRAVSEIVNANIACSSSKVGFLIRTLTAPNIQNTSNDVLPATMQRSFEHNSYKVSPVR